MTEKQRRFCLCYAKNANATQSAIEAGYSQKTARSIGQKLLTNIDIQNELKRLAEENAQKQIADATEMQKVLTSIIRQEMEEECIVVEGCGDGVSEAVTKTKKSAHKDVLKAIDLLGRMQGAFNDKQTLNVVIPVFEGEDDLED